MGKKIWGRGGTPAGERRVKTSLVISERLLLDLKLAALQERTDVSALLCRLGAAYLKAGKGRRG